MAPISIVGVVLVHFALVSYGVGIVTEQRTHKVTAKAFRFLLVGVAFDIAATTCMVIGSGEGLTLHGLLGFSALAAMLGETTLAWRHRAMRGEADVPGWLHWSSRLAYGWWCVAYVAGAAMVAMGA